MAVTPIKALLFLAGGMRRGRRRSPMSSGALDPLLTGPPDDDSGAAGAPGKADPKDAPGLPSAEPPQPQQPEKPAKPRTP